MRNQATNSTVIVVANRPRIFRELLCQALTDASERFEVIEVGAENELAKNVRGQQADWLIVSTDENRSLPSQAQSLLNGQSDLSAIAISADGSDLEVLAAGERERTRQHYQNISLAELVSVLSTTPNPVTS